MTTLAQMGQWTFDLAGTPISSPVRKRVGLHVLDTVGAWIAGSTTEEGARLKRLQSAELNEFAIFANRPFDQIALGVGTVRLTETDDVHMMSCTTPSSIVVPTALLIASNSTQPRASHFAQALCAGYEVITRLGAAVDGPNVVYRGIWPTFLAAPLGAAAVTAKLLGLSAVATANALAIALTLTSGAPGGSTEATPRWLLIGLAARSGCVAALAAEQGFTGDLTLLDGDWLTRTHGVPCNIQSPDKSAFQNFAIEKISLKPYCAAKQCIAAIEAMTNLTQEGIALEQIAAVRVHVPPAYVALVGHRRASEGRIPRITGVPYNLALAAYKPEALKDISRPNLADQEPIAAFIQRVEVVGDTDLGQQFPGTWGARVELLLKNGTSVSNSVQEARGDPSRALNEGEVCGKFHSLTDPIIGRAAAVRLANACISSAEHDEAFSELCDWVNSEPDSGEKRKSP